MRKTPLVLVGLGLLVLLDSCIPLFGSSGSNDMGGAAGSDTLYDIELIAATDTVGTMTISYPEPDGGTNIEDTSNLNWSADFVYDTETAVSGAVSMNIFQSCTGCTVTATIKIDGVVVDTGSGTDGGIGFANAVAQYYF